MFGKLNDLEQNSNEFDMFGDIAQDEILSKVPVAEPEDDEGAMLKADLIKIAKYSYKLFKKINDNDQFEAWVQAKVVKAADYIASVYHYLEYEMEFSEYGKRLDNSEMYTESQKIEMKQKLLEAKQKLSKIKIAQAEKASRADKLALADTNKKTILNKSKPKASDPVKLKEAPTPKTPTKSSKNEKTAKVDADKKMIAANMWKTAKKKAIKESTMNGVPHGSNSSPKWPVDANEETDLTIQKQTHSTTIPNPDVSNSSAGPDINVTVEYSISGKDVPATFYDPGEQSDIEIHSVINDETGESLEITDSIYDQLVNEILNQQTDDDFDYDSDDKIYESERAPRRSVKSNNFTADDINQLEKIRDLEQVKARAIELISAKSIKSMKPEKIEWFTREIQEKSSKPAVIKLMYDLLLSGEGLGVIGTSRGMNPNSYRKRFSESLTESADLGSILKLAGLQKL